MREIDKKKFSSSKNKSINIKISNMDMKISINKQSKKVNLCNSYLIDKVNIKNYVLPSFTKKFFSQLKAINEEDSYNRCRNFWFVSC